jgi:cell wall assembly regulator SMI1
MTTIQNDMQRIETWLHTHAPALLEHLPAGASDEDLAQAEAMMGGLTLPDDFKAAYHRHDGWGTPLVFLGRLTVYPLAGVIGTWQMMRDLLEAGDFDRGLNWKHEPLHFNLTDPIRPVWWHLAWLPFAGNESGEEWAVDLAPAPGGKAGQVIDWEHESGPGHVQATSLQALFAAFAEDLEAGRYLGAGLRLELVSDRGTEPILPPLAPQPLPVLSRARQLLKQAYDAGRASAVRNRTWINDSVAQQMLPLLLTVLDLEESQLEDRLLACEWLLQIHLALDQFEDAKALLPRCQREAEQAPPHYEIHRTLRGMRATLAEA